MAIFPGSNFGSGSLAGDAIFQAAKSFGAVPNVPFFDERKLFGFRPYELAGTPVTAIPATTATVGAPGNQAGMQQFNTVMQMIKDPNTPETVRNTLAAGLSSFGGSNQLDLTAVTKQAGQNAIDLIKETELIRARESVKANEMGRENLKLASDLSRRNMIFGTLLQMPGQIADSFVRAQSAALPVYAETNRVMAQMGPQLREGFGNVASTINSGAANITNILSNSAAGFGRNPSPIAGKYFS